MLSPNQIKLAHVCAFLTFFPGTEGEGGRRGTFRDDGSKMDDWKVGTRLRAPKAPLYDMGPKDRAKVLNFLLDKGYLTVYKTDGESKYYGVTPYGLERLKAIDHRLYFVATKYSPQPGTTWHNRFMVFMTPSEVNEWATNTPGSNSSREINRRYDYDGKVRIFDPETKEVIKNEVKTETEVSS